MVGTALNTDPIKPELGISHVFGLIVLAGIILWLATARARNRTPFVFFLRGLFSNLALHIFILTGIIFLSFLFFGAAIQIAVLHFNAPIFQKGCERISERDVSLFVWHAMAQGALKFVANYVPLPDGSCPPNLNQTASGIAALAIRWFTALVVVWYVIGLGRAWYSLSRARAEAPHTGDLAQP